MKEKKFSVAGFQGIERRCERLRHRYQRDFVNRILFENLDQVRCHKLIEFQRGSQQAKFAVMLPAAGKQAEHCENNQALSLGHGQHQNVNDAKTIGP